MRATRRRLRRNSLGASSFSVCCLMRRRNKFSLASLSVSPSCSSLMSRSSVILAIAKFREAVAALCFLTLSSYHADTDRHFVRESCQTNFCGRFGDTTQFVQDRAWPDNGRPIFRFAFTLTHAGFKWDGGDRPVREHTDVEPPFASN